VEITISDGKTTAVIPDPVLNRLAVHVNRTNDKAGTALNTVQWLELHIRELAIADQFAALTGPLQEQAQTDARRLFEEALSGERDRLLREL
jgi:hypothetical protein